MTAEQRAQVVDLLADGLLVWQVADRVGVDRRAVACVKGNWLGRILGMRRERLGQRIDGTPIAACPPPEPRVLRARTLYCGPHRRISLRPGGLNDATIRLTLDAAWTDEAARALCRALSRMSGDELDALIQKIRGGG